MARHNLDAAAESANIDMNTSSSADGPRDSEEHESSSLADSTLRQEKEDEDDGHVDITIMKQNDKERVVELASPEAPLEQKEDTSSTSDDMDLEQQMEDRDKTAGDSSIMSRCDKKEVVGIVGLQAPLERGEPAGSTPKDTSLEPESEDQDKAIVDSKVTKRCATEMVLGTTELLEQIMSYLPARDLLLSQRNSRNFRQTYEGSTKLKQIVQPPPATPRNWIANHPIDFYIDVTGKTEEEIESLRSLTSPEGYIEVVADSPVFTPITPNLLLFNLSTYERFRRPPARQLHCIVDVFGINEVSSCLDMHITQPPTSEVHLCTPRSPNETVQGRRRNPVLVRNRRGVKFGQVVHAAKKHGLGNFVIRLPAFTPRDGHQCLFEDYIIDYITASGRGRQFDPCWLWYEMWPDAKILELLSPEDLKNLAMVNKYSYRKLVIHPKEEAERKKARRYDFLWDLAVFVLIGIVGVLMIAFALAVALVLLGKTIDKLAEAFRMWRELRPILREIWVIWGLLVKQRGWWRGGQVILGAWLEAFLKTLLS